MSKYIDAERLYEYLEQVSGLYPRYADNIVDNAVGNVIVGIKTFITSLQQEQPMPDSTELIAKWEEEKDVLKQMDFRGDEWRLAQNAFMDGVGIGLSVKQEKPEVDLEKELDRYLRGEFQQTAGGNFNNYIQVARHFYELGLNARKEVDLDALVDEAFDKYSSVDGYGQLSASFNRAELYSFIKKIARKEE